MRQEFLLARFHFYPASEYRVDFDLEVGTQRDMARLTRRHFLGYTSALGFSNALGLTGALGAAQLLGARPLAAENAAPTDNARRILGALRLGNASHAFDHLGEFGAQAEAAAKCGATVIYASGIGGDGYGGIPAPEEWQQRLEAVRAYTKKAHDLGIPVVIGYLCATSIVGLEGFDKHWTPEFRAKFPTPAAQWLQVDAEGQSLPSWYGGEYRPACMNNPVWRAYQKELIRFQLETGHDGIFYDNPTVHPKGCYCEHCMARFARFIGNDTNTEVPTDLAELRECAAGQRNAFRRFRATIARDFLAEMREWARTINPDALITANNSTNSPGVLYSQCTTYGYSPFEMSRSEDFVVIEDMGSQPRTTDDGKVIEYGPTYKQLKALCHGKPLVVCTIADADYHTPPNLMRLAMAEAAANQATYLAWPCWPEEHRERLSAAVRLQNEFLRKYAYTFEDTVPRADCSLFLPMRRWLDTDTCAASDYAAQLVRENVQFIVFTEETFREHSQARNLIHEGHKLLTQPEKSALATSNAPQWPADTSPNWLRFASEADARRAVKIKDAPRVRAYVHDAEDATYVHLLNLDIRKRSSFEDEVFPARDLTLNVYLDVPVRTYGDGVQAKPSLTAEVYTADEQTTRGSIDFTFDEKHRYATVKLPLLEVAAILAFKIV